MADVTDTFTGTANSALTTADTGQSWSAFGGGTVGRDGAGRATTTVASGDAGEVIDSGVPDGTTQVTIVNGSNQQGGLVFRWLDGSNFWVVQLSGSTLYTRKFVAGTYTDRTNGGISFADGDVLTVVTAGDLITVKRNGATLQSFNDSFNQSATKGGLLARPGAVYDDFSIANAASGGTATKVVFVTQPIGNTSSNLLSTQPVVQIQDASSVLVSSASGTVTVSLITVSGSGTLSGTTTKAITAGSVAWTDLRVSGTGTFKLRATSGSLTLADSSNFTYTGRANSPYLGLAADASDLGATMSLINTAVALNGDRRSVTESRPVGGNFSYNGSSAAYPAEILDTDTFPTRTGTLRNVNGDAQLQAALTAAVPGDWIIVNHASTYTADYTNAFPFKAGDTRPGGNNVIVLMAKAMYDSLDIFTGLPTFLPPKVRVTAAALPQMPRFINTLASGSFMVAGNTRGWRFVGLSFEQSPSQPTSQHFVSLGSGDAVQQSAVSTCPVNLGVDRCAFKGAPGNNMKHCLELHCVAGFAQDCFFGDYIRTDPAVYSESHVIFSFNGPGPFRIVNNFINGGSQSIFFGGAYSACGAPADIEVRYNWLTRPLTWNPSHPTYDGSSNAVKCNFELKFAKRLIAEHNYNENIWVAAQQGAAWLLKSEAYGSGPQYGYTSDIIVRNNYTRNAGYGVNIAGVDNVELAQPPQRVIYHNNVTRIGAQYFSGAVSPMAGLALSTDCALSKNTFVAEGTVNNYIAFSLPNNPATRLKLDDNIFSGPTSYGWKADSVTIDTYGQAGGFAPGATARSNVVQVVPGENMALYPSGTLTPATQVAIVFTDAQNADYSLFNGSAPPPPTTMTANRAVAYALRVMR